MWDQRYSEPGFAYGSEPNDFLVGSAGRLAPGSRVLCVAEGEGRNAVYLAGLGHRVTAVDLSPVGLAKAAELARARGVQIETVCADLATYEPGEGRWDAVVSVWAHLPPAVRVAAHARMVRALAPGGWLLLEAYAPAQLALNTGGPRSEELLYRLDMLRVDFKGLSFEQEWTGEREVREGRYHQGRSAVVQVVAKKG